MKKIHILRKYDRGKNNRPKKKHPRTPGRMPYTLYKTINGKKYPYATYFKGSPPPIRPNTIPIKPLSTELHQSVLDYHNMQLHVKEEIKQYFKHLFNINNKPK